MESIGNSFGMTKDTDEDDFTLASGTHKFRTYSIYHIKRFLESDLARSILVAYRESLQQRDNLVM